MSTSEQITSNGELLASIFYSGAPPPKTTFVTAPEDNLQVGFIVYPAGGSIQRHAHKQQQRLIVGTAEALYVKKGRCEIDIFDNARALVATRELRTGDLILLLRGGHGFRMLEDTVFLEIKQGPYLGEDDKEHF